MSAVRQVFVRLAMSLTCLRGAYAHVWPPLACQLREAISEHHGGWPLDWQPQKVARLGLHRIICNWILQELSGETDWQCQKVVFIREWYIMVWKLLDQAVLLMSAEPTSDQHRHYIAKCSHTSRGWMWSECVLVLLIMVLMKISSWWKSQCAYSMKPLATYVCQAQFALPICGLRTWCFPCLNPYTLVICGCCIAFMVCCLKKWCSQWYQDIGIIWPRVPTEMAI